MTFALDSRIDNDSIELAQTKECLILLMNDSRFVWLTLVPKSANITELYQLSDDVRKNVQEQSNVLMKSLMQEFKGDSANIGALGNVVSQLHIHHIVRFQKDECWPGPVWGQGKMKPYTPAQLEPLLERLETTVMAVLSQK